MMSLFSSFDIYFNSMPVSVFILVSSFVLAKFYKLNFFNSMFGEIKGLNSFFFSLKPKMFSKLTLVLIIGVMISIFVVNFFSVFSFIFPFTSQFGTVLILGLSLWVSFVLFSIYNNSSGFLSHLIPEGSPVYLTVLLFMIELVSNIIRPITLSVRLVANILAGHLLMILLSKLIFTNFLIFPLYVILNMVELFVALIQSYIFCTMISLYFSEIH